MKRRRPSPAPQLDLAGMEESQQIAFTTRGLMDQLGVGYTMALHIVKAVGRQTGPAGKRWIVEREALVRYLKGKGGATR